MKHFKTMTEAVRAAAQLCPDWIVIESGDYVDADAAAYIARVTDRLDHEDDAASETYYLVSDEGAVGVTSKYEYLAQWILMPLMRPMEEIEAEIEAELRRQQQQVQQAEQTRQGAAAPTAETPAFCPYCGYKQQPGAKFCPDCGRRF